YRRDRAGCAGNLLPLLFEAEEGAKLEVACLDTLVNPIAESSAIGPRHVHILRNFRGFLQPPASLVFPCKWARPRARYGKSRSFRAIRRRFGVRLLTGRL